MGRRLFASPNWLSIQIGPCKLNAGWALLGSERTGVLSTNNAIDRRARSSGLGHHPLPFPALGQCESSHDRNQCSPPMADTATDNPYKPASLSSGVMPVGLTRVQAVLVALLAIVLLLRGGFMLFSWGMQLFSGFRLDSHFNAAIVTKDGIYGISAFIGGLMLLARNRIGWWFALVHWCWCVACR